MRTVWIFYYAILIHAIWGALIIHDGLLDRVSLAFVVTPFVEGQLAGWLLIFTSVWASIGIAIDPRSPLRSWTFIAPQQFIMLLSSFETIGLLWAGESMGKPFARELGLFILAPILIGALCHTLAVIDHHWRPAWKLYRFR